MPDIRPLSVNELTKHAEQGHGCALVGTFIDLSHTEAVGLMQQLLMQNQSNRSADKHVPQLALSGSNDGVNLGRILPSQEPPLLTIVDKPSIMGVRCRDSRLD